MAASQLTATWLAFLAASGSIVLTTSAISGASAKGSSCSSIRPASILERSRMFIDQREKMPASTEHAIEWLSVLLQRLCIFAQHLADTDDGIERRAQLMAHVGEELRLVLASLGKLATLVLDFVEQPYILDCDHRLVGERLEEIHLTVGEGTRGRSKDRNRPNRLTFAEHWHGYDAPIASSLRQPTKGRVI